LIFSSDDEQEKFASATSITTLEKRMISLRIKFKYFYN